jgi:hypothetical protein
LEGFSDGIDEGDTTEEAKIVLADGSDYIAERSGVNGRRDSATVNIEDTNPPKVWMSQADDSAEEGGYDANDVTRTGSVRFHRNGNPSQPLTVNFQTDGSATYGLGDGQDYGFTNAASNTSFTIPAGLSWADLVIAPRYDNLYEPTETVSIILASGSGYTVDLARTVTSAWVGIINVDQLPRVQSLSVSPSKPGTAENGGTATISATLSNKSAYPVTIPLTFPTGTGFATPNVDYTISASSITIPAGAMTGSVTLTALPDSLIEGNETVRVRISTATNATVPAPLEADTTILDRTAVVTIQATDDTADEADDTAEFSITRSAATGQTLYLNDPLTVQYYIDLNTYRQNPDGSYTNNAATPDIDYWRETLSGDLYSDYNTSNTVTIASGQSSARILIHGIPDTIVEGSETILFALVNNPGYVIGAVAQASATLLDVPDTRDIVVVGGQTKAVEGAAGERGQIKLRFTRKSDTLLALPVSLKIRFSTTTLPEGTIQFGHAASADDFDPSPRDSSSPDPEDKDAKKAIFDLNRIYFPAGAKEVDYILNVKANDGPEGLEGFQVEIDDDRVKALGWGRFPSPASPTFAGNAVTAYIVDGITLYAKENTNPDLKDDQPGNPLPAGNPGIHPNDVNQGGVRGCFVMAALAALAKSRPDVIQNAIVPTSDPFKYQVRLYDFGHIGATGKETFVTVTLDFSNGYAAAEFAGDYLPAAGANLVEVWPQVMEQAIEQVWGRVNVIGGGAGAGNPFETIFKILTGKGTATFPSGLTLAEQIRTAVVDYKRPVILSTKIFAPYRDFKDPVSNKDVTVGGSHAYPVLEVDDQNKRIKLYDVRLRTVSEFWLNYADINNSDVFGTVSAMLLPPQE